MLNIFKNHSSLKVDVLTQINQSIQKIEDLLKDMFTTKELKKEESLSCSSIKPTFRTGRYKRSCQKVTLDKFNEIRHLCVKHSDSTNKEIGERGGVSDTVVSEISRCADYDTFCDFKKEKAKRKQKRSYVVTKEMFDFIKRQRKKRICYRVIAKKLKIGESTAMSYGLMEKYPGEG